MTRKDTILIAVVINAGLLAVLFTTAVIYDTDKEGDQTEFLASAVNTKAPESEAQPELIAAVAAEDEVDHVLKYYTSPQPKNTAAEVKPKVVVQQPEIKQEQRIVQREAPKVIEPALETSSTEQYVEVTVKRGDVLEKIARANKSSVSAIKQANNLTGEHLSIGQVLKVPLKQGGSSSSTSVAKKETVQSKPDAKVEQKKVVKESDPVYYTVESGDNPWKIAKKFGVKYDEILRLNHLDEDKARNLKIGDRIRVK